MIHFVIYTDRMRDEFWAKTHGPVIFIRPKHRDNHALLKHELEHVRQFWITLGMHGLLYLFSRRYRLWSEAKAYAVQVRYGADLDWMARNLCMPVYSLNITPERARSEILKYM